MGERATDVISKTLASIPPGKLEEVLMGMKVSESSSPKGTYCDHISPALIRMV